MSSISTIFLNANSHSNSLLEKIADFCLTPARSLFNGHRFVLLKNNECFIRFEDAICPKAAFKIEEQRQEENDNFQYSNGPKKSSKVDQFLSYLKKIIHIASLIIVPLGMALKLIAFYSSNKVRESFKDWAPLELTTKNETTIRTLFNQCLTNGLIKELYEDICSRPLQYAHFKISADGDKIFNFYPLEFSECACNRGTFNRVLNSRRADIEKAILSDIKADCPITSSISLLSLGSGGLFQDFIIIGKLIQEGYKAISLTLVDPEIDDKKVESLKNFLGNFNDVKIDIYSYKNVHQIPQEERFNAIYAIDYDQFENTNIKDSIDIIANLKQLDSNGNLYLCYAENDYVWNEKKGLKYMQGGARTPLISNVSKKIKSYLSKHSKDSLQIGVFSNVTRVFPLLLGLLKAMKKSPKDKTLNFKILKFEDARSLYKSDVDKTSQFITLLFEQFTNMKIDIVNDLSNDKNKYDFYFDVGNPAHNITKNFEKLFLKKSGLGFIRDGRGVRFYPN